jgi:thioredoxin reductase (NADPH)
MERVKCLIIGSGPAGYTAAIYASRAGLNPVLYEGLQPGGQLTTTTEVDNFPGYPKGVTGTAMMEDLNNQALRFGTDVRFGYVSGVEFNKALGHPHKVVVDGKIEILADTVIISTGASAKWLGLESEQRLNGFGVSACAVCDGFFYKGQDVVVVGGGDTACEEASYLSKLCRRVYLLVRGDKMRASQAMQSRVNSIGNIEVFYNTGIEEIEGGNTVDGVLARRNGHNIVIKATGVFVAIGHKPNTDLFKGQLELDDHGYIITHGKTSKTNIQGVFACGDVQDSHYRQAITAAGSGCMAALDAERFLTDVEMYKQAYLK